MDAIKQMLVEDGQIPSASSNEPTPAKEGDDWLPDVEEVGKKRRKLFINTERDETDSLPMEFRHLRESERIVKQSVYQTIAQLVGSGLSQNESAKAICIVGNNLFGRDWKQLDDEANEETFDKDTLPAKSRIKEALHCTMS